MLAMDVNDNAGNLTPCGVLSSIASMLAPTGDLFVESDTILPATIAGHA